MAYDQPLADRICDLVVREEGLTRKLMLGGLSFLINGNMPGQGWQCRVPVPVRCSA